MEILLILVGFIAVLLYSNWLLGYNRKNIVLTFDERFENVDAHAAAIVVALKEKGKDATYLGSRIFQVGNKEYVLVTRTVSMEGVPLEQTILQPR